MRLPEMPMLAPDTSEDLRLLWSYVATIKQRLSQVGTVDLDGETGAIVIRDLTGVVRIIFGQVGTGPDDWGIQIFSPTGVLMYDSTIGGATTEGIQVDAVSNLGSVLVANVVTTSSLTWVDIPDMTLTVITRGGVILVTATLTAFHVRNPDVAIFEHMVGRVRLMRGTTVLTTGDAAISLHPLTSFFFPMTLTYMDVGIPPGTYTYKLQWIAADIGGVTSEVSSPLQRHIQAVELKR